MSLSVIFFLILHACSILVPAYSNESHYGKTSGRGQRSKFNPFCTDFNLIFFARVGAQRCPSCCRFSLCRQQLEWLSLVCTSKLSSFGLGEDLGRLKNTKNQTGCALSIVRITAWTRVAVPQNLCW